MQVGACWRGLWRVQDSIEKVGFSEWYCECWRSVGEWVSRQLGGWKLRLRLTLESSLEVPNFFGYRAACKARPYQRVAPHLSDRRRDLLWALQGYGLGVHELNFLSIWIVKEKVEGINLKHDNDVYCRSAWTQGFQTHPFSVRTNFATTSPAMPTSLSSVIISQAACCHYTDIVQLAYILYQYHRPPCHVG